MDNINGFGFYSYNNDNTLVKQERLFEEIPPELIQKIFGYLAPIDIQHASCVSFKWCDSIIDVAYYEEIWKIRNFANLLFSCFKKGALVEEKTAIFHVLDKESDVFPKNLIEIKREIFFCQEIVLNILKKLNINDLGVLKHFIKDMLKPAFFNNIFDLADIYKQMAAMDYEANDFYKCYEQIQLSIRLVSMENGNVDKAVDVVNAVFKIDNNQQGFSPFFKALVMKGHVDKALEIIHKNLTGRKKIEAFEKIFTMCIWSENIQSTLDKVIGVKGYMFLAGSEVYRVSRAKVSRAINMLERILIEGVYQDGCKGSIKYNINDIENVFRGLEQSGNPMIAPATEEMLYVLKELIWKGDKIFFQFIQDVCIALEDITRFFERISSLHAEYGYYINAQEVANLIPKQYQRFDAILNVLMVLTKRGYFDRALELIKGTGDPKNWLGILSDKLGLDCTSVLAEDLSIDRGNFNRIYARIALMLSQNKM